MKRNIDICKKCSLFENSRRGKICHLSSDDEFDFVCYLIDNFNKEMKKMTYEAIKSNQYDIKPFEERELPSGCEMYTEYFISECNKEKSNGHS